MEPVRINIPSVQPSEAREVTDVFGTIREAGLDPAKALCSRMMQGVALDYKLGTITRAEFINGCRNMGIFNPSLKAVQ